MTDLRIAVVCSSNQNRSMEAHSFLSKRGFQVKSFGTGTNVKLPGAAPDKPNIYDFNTTYDDMYQDLLRKDRNLYTQNGILHMIDRNRRIKPKPERFQSCYEKFDLVFTAEERVFDQCVEELSSREPVENQPVHIVNIDIQDNHEEATIGAFLICELCQLKSFVYLKVWERSSKHPIIYDNNKLYLDKFQHCYTVCGRHGVPTKIYTLPNLFRNERVEDTLTFVFALEQLPMEHEVYKGSLFVLKANNWLVRYAVDTGEVLQQVYLPSSYKFKHLEIDTTGYTFVVKSTHTRPAAGLLTRQAASVPVKLMALAVFAFAPLTFVGMMEISKSVFGSDTCDATILQEALVTMHQSGIVKIYSFERILQTSKVFEASLGKPCMEWDNVIPGVYPNGLPFNIVISELPPVLFQVRCADHNIQVGGFPWHFITTPVGCQNTFHIRSFQDYSLATNGELMYDSTGIEADKAFFHPDESGRIIHSTGHKFRVLKLIPSSSNKVTVTPCFTFNNKVQLYGHSANSIEVTSSGRIVKHTDRFNNKQPYAQCIHSVDYENELDLLYVIAATPSSNGDSKVGHVLLCHNLTVDIVKDVVLDGIWDEDDDHTVIVDLDLIIHIVQSPGRKFLCSIYKLDRTLLDEESPFHKYKPPRLKICSTLPRESDSIAPQRPRRLCSMRRL